MSLNTNQLRQQLIALREQQPYNETRRGALLMRGRLYTWLNLYRNQRQEQGITAPLNIAAFWSLPSEPELEPLLLQWVDDPELHVSLPCVVNEDEALVFKPWNEDTQLKPAKFGVQEPDTDLIAPDPDIILVPTLGFTRQGDRMGYGKGYYDRTLAQLRAKEKKFVSIGIAWAVGDLSAYSYLPAPHDQRLDSILTDKGWAVPAPN